MNTLDRYIGWAVAMGTLGAMLVLLSLIGVLELANELNDVGKGDYSVAAAFRYVAMIMPRFAYELFPVGVLLGSLSGLGVLAKSSEFVAMRAAGISLGRIVLAVMKTGIILMVVVILIGELVAPVSEQKAQHLRAEAISDQITLHTRYGFWARDGEAFVNIRRVVSGTTLADIYIYEFDADRTLKKALYAASAQYNKDHWVLRGIRQNEFSPEGVVSAELKQAAWSSLIDPGLLSVLAVKPHVLPLWGLYKYIEFLRENGQNPRTFQVAFWGKLANPLVTLVMLFLSIPFLFGPLRAASVGQRVFFGAMAGIGFFLLNKAVSHVAVVYGLNPVVSASFPGLLLMGVALFMMRRVR